MKNILSLICLFGLFSSCASTFKRKMLDSAKENEHKVYEFKDSKFYRHPVLFQTSNISNYLFKCYFTFHKDNTNNDVILKNYFEYILKSRYFFNNINSKFNSIELYDSEWFTYFLNRLLFITWADDVLGKANSDIFVMLAQGESDYYTGDGKTSDYGKKICIKKDLFKLMTVKNRKFFKVNKNKIGNNTNPYLLIFKDKFKLNKHDIHSILNFENYYFIILWENHSNNLQNVYYSIFKNTKRISAVDFQYLNMLSSKEAYDTLKSSYFAINSKGRIVSQYSVPSNDSLIYFDDTSLQLPYSERSPCFTLGYTPATLDFFLGAFILVCVFYLLERIFNFFKALLFNS